jgi:hypothetical protein
MSKCGPAGKLTSLIDSIATVSTRKVKGMFPRHTIKLDPVAINPLVLSSSNIAIASCVLVNWLTPGGRGIGTFDAALHISGSKTHQGRS